MDTTVRATCPKCQTTLRIPAQWVGQAVKCKKCGTVVRSKPRSGDVPVPQPHSTTPAAAPPAPNAFDFAQPPPNVNDDWPLPEPTAPPAPEVDNRFDPTGGADVTTQQPVQPMPVMPGYGYPIPPGYAPPAGYGLPPGYPYAPPPGYPYPVPHGYPYPVPPGYAPPAGYGVPPGYPYAMTPADPNAPAPAPGAAYPYPAPYPAAPLMPAMPVDAPAAYDPNMPGAAPVAPAPVPASDEFRTDPAAAAARRYRRASGKHKWIWVAVCVLLTGGIVTGGIFAVKYLKEEATKPNSDPTADLVRQLGSEDAAARNEAFARLKAMGPKAEAALKDGEKSEHAAVAKHSKELLAILAGAPPTPGGPGTVAKVGQFPRRMLFISISKYMYLNPLTYAEINRDESIGPDRTRPAAQRLAYEWNIPNDPRNADANQLFVLSDSARPDNPKADVPLPMRNVVTGTYERFFETSRAQDRVVVYFGGHALEKDGVAYLAPIEGDPDDPKESLIPLADFYEKLKACKATQKVMIWDVCRFNPQRGRQRPGSEPMSPTLHEALTKAPEGVEVVITCKAGENALEFSSHQFDSGAANEEKVAGSAFLEAVRYVGAKAARNPGKQPTQADPIQLANWSPLVAKRLVETGKSAASLRDFDPEMAKKDQAEGYSQTLTVAGKPREDQVAFNAEEPPAKRFEMPTPPRGSSPAEVASIVNEFTVPPISAQDGSGAVNDIPYLEAVMKDYKADATVAEIMADKEKYKFRVATIAALDKIRKMWATAPGATGGPTLRKTVDAPVTDKTKNDIKNEQEFWAFGIAELELLNDELDKVRPLKEGEPKRWQAHYEYARAVLKARLAYMNEFNKLMGDVLTENLPARDEKLGHDGYKLVPSEKMKSKKDVQQLAKDAKEAYQTLVTEYKGTPWAIQAKRDKSFTLGLTWQPAVLKNTTP